MDQGQGCAVLAPPGRGPRVRREAEQIMGKGKSIFGPGSSSRAPVVGGFGRVEQALCWGLWQHGRERVPGLAFLKPWAPRDGEGTGMGGPAGCPGARVSLSGATGLHKGLGLIGNSQPCF